MVGRDFMFLSCFFLQYSSNLLLVKEKDGHRKTLIDKNCPCFYHGHLPEAGREIHTKFDRMMDDDEGPLAK